MCSDKKGNRGQRTGNKERKEERLGGERKHGEDTKQGV